MTASNQTPTPTLDQRALLIRLSISQWSGRKLDRTVTLEATSQHGATSDAGRFNKLLVPREALRPCEQVAYAARKLLDTNSLPWTYDGTRIATVEAYEGIVSGLGVLRQTFLIEAEKMVADLPTHIHCAPDRLGTMFQLADYPTVERLRRAYSFDVEVSPVPTANDFRVQGMPDVDKIRSEIEQRIQLRLGAAVADAWQRVHDCCKDVAERLVTYETSTGRQGAFRDSLVSNVRSLADALPALNLTGDPNLDQMANRLRADLAAFEPDDLRKHSWARANVLKAARKLQQESATMIGEANPFGASNSAGALADQVGGIQ